MAFFRLTQLKNRGGTVLSIDGQFAGECLRVVEECCSQALSSGTRVSLFLRDVSLIDAPGRDLLRQLAAQGVRLLASGIYNSYVVQNLQRVRAGRPAALTGNRI